MKINKQNFEIVDKLDKGHVTEALYMALYGSKDWAVILTPFRGIKMSKESKIDVAYDCLLQLEKDGSTDKIDYIYCVSSKLVSLRLKTYVSSVKTLGDWKKVIAYGKKHNLSDEDYLLIDDIMDVVRGDGPLDVCRKLYQKGKYLRCLRHLLMQIEKFEEEDIKQIRIACMKKLNYEKEL